MKALVLTEYMQFELADVPEPSPAANEVLVRVRACGICGSDVHGMDGSTGRRIPPIIMGHEAAGEIAATGMGVTRFREGDRITFDSTVYCGACDYCRGGRINLCENRRVLGVSCEEYRLHGAFAEYAIVPERTVYPLPDTLSYEHAAMTEALSVAMHAVSRVPQAPRSACVIGAGMIGLLVVQALRIRGAEAIVAVDLDPRKLELARQLGATDTIDAGVADVAESVTHLTGGGAEAVFEAVGLPATVEAAVRAARKGGAVVLVGNVTPSVPLPLQASVTRELTLFGSCASSGEIPACLAAMASGAVQVAPLISAVAPLANGPQWFKRLHDAEPGLMKVVLTP